jgi:DNA invertase Pin-like site-specific DNA recombinase
VIRAEKVSGTRREGRTELETLRHFLRPGDTLVVTRIDAHHVKRGRDPRPDDFSTVLDAADTRVLSTPPSHSGKF